MCSSYRFFIGSLIASFIGLSICLNHIRVLMVNKSHHVIVYCVQFKDDFVAHQFLFWIPLHIRQCRCYGASPCFSYFCICIFVFVFLYLSFNFSIYIVFLFLYLFTSDSAGGYVGQPLLFVVRPKLFPDFFRAPCRCDMDTIWYWTFFFICPFNWSSIFGTDICWSL